MNKELIYKSIKGFCPEIEMHASIDSTNIRATSLAREGAEEWQTVIAACQTAGRGRLERSFFSPEGSGLYMSTVLYPNEENVSLITGKAAVAARRAVLDAFGIECSIKWVNDIYIGEKKVAGILASSICNEGRISVVLGIGFNVFMPEGGFPEEIKSRAGALLPSYEEGALEKLAGCFLSRMHEILSFGEDAQAAKEYREHCITVGKEIEIYPIHDKSEKRIARALNVDESFHLLVEYPTGQREYLCSGEVSIKNNE